MRKVFLIAALIGLLPAQAYVGNVGNDVAKLAFPSAHPGLKPEWVQFAEGLLTEVDPEVQVMRIETLEGTPMTFQYSGRTEVEGVEDSVTGCFGPKKEPRVRVHFQTAKGVNMAMRIELLASQT